MARDKKAVLIDLEEWGESWEDIYDVLIACSRQDEPTVDWEELKNIGQAHETAEGGGSTLNCDNKA